VEAEHKPETEVAHAAAEAKAGHLFHSSANSSWVANRPQHIRPQVSVAEAGVSVRCPSPLAPHSPPSPHSPASASEAAVVAPDSLPHLQGAVRAAIAVQQAADTAVAAPY
jgi:hypothetical protein